MKPKTGEIKYIGLGRLAINPIKINKVMPKRRLKDALARECLRSCQKSD